MQEQDRLSWNGIDERAYVPTADMHASLDVLPGAPAGVADSPSPFSVGVYTVDHSAAENVPVPMRMYFVSRSVAEDRSQNEPPMQSGWYICVDDACSEFEVRISVRGEKLRESFDCALSGCDIASMRLFVDGEDCRSRRTVCRDRDGASEIVRKGFVEKRESGGTIVRLRTFKFTKLSLKEEDRGSPSEQEMGAGALELRVFGGNESGTKPISTNDQAHVLGRLQSMSEKTAIKKGISLGVSRDGAVVSTLSKPCNRLVSNWKALDELFVLVNIRERSWLTRRRIVTESGGPCSGREAESMLAKKRTSLVEPRKKKPKVEKLEAVDLT